MVRYACIVNELKHANGRTGMGAVMGSKNLRAIAARGTTRLSFADPEKVREIGKKVLELLPQSVLAQNLKKFGTPMFVMPLNNSGILPTRNFQKGQFEGAEAICGEKMTDTILVKSEGCYACAVQCKRAVKVEGKYNAAPEYGGPEYETVASLGSYCGIDNLAAIAPVSGFYLAHPEARYFAVGKIGKDQIEDYASRKGMGQRVIERWLSPNLNYEST